MHRIYHAAERLGVANVATNDELQATHPIGSVAADYVQTLLLHRASPYEFSPQQLSQVWQWLQPWGRKVDILPAPPAAPRVPPLIVDLISAQAEIPQPKPDGAVRWLDLSDLSRSLKKRVVLLQRGESPTLMGLGDDCVQPDCGNLLKHLYQHWFKGGMARQHQRRPGSGKCGLVTGFDALHYYLSGKVFQQPGHAAELTPQQHEEIATFGRIATRPDEDTGQVQGQTIEEWQVRDESPVGLRLSRPLAQTGARIGGGQLVAVRPDGTRTFLLAIARWVRITNEQELQTGVQLFPGTPQPVAIRGIGAPEVNEKYRQGFLLPPVPLLNEPEAVIVPAGWFRSGRIIELCTDTSRQIRLTNLLDRGSDFERSAFEPA